MPFTIKTDNMDGLAAAIHAVRDEVTATRAFLDNVTAGTVSADQAVVVDENSHFDVANVTTLAIGASGAEVAVLATPTEINRVCDASTRIVTVVAATLAVTEALHDGKTIVMDQADGIAITLPAATGSGMRLRFVVGSVSTTGYVIKSVVGTDLMEGCIIGNDGAAVTTSWRWQAGAGDDTITLNGTTSGGVDIGDWVELEDISAVGWAVRGIVSQSGNEETPFSNTVT